ncbi:hypothetical protein CO174_04130 [Candidatus Uhrbacteria bacterium CG_4_9_14_3_um_filter_50_9]|uniref:asparagine synthase (glutamine-hydrolyzing) n=1 Tax=Candidatus Uhrbacteria bacterium CG_4_9_14_3_um_filter_50_9 TaxID=1975035 RepID=A0A2M7XBM6_9BACT|nr:MAG: hypothetical protein CO174_04130 [Candidatus Uhrbacteria bacterium CG_4_9_14_3_um_filter_50_9]
MYDRLREVLAQPIVRQASHPWSPRGLLDRLAEAHQVCAHICQERNNGLIPLCLSGGLDSTTSLGLLTRLVPKDSIHTFTICQGPEHADGVFSRLAAEHFGVRHTLLMPTQEQIQQMQLELPKASLGAIATRLLYHHLSEVGVHGVIAHDGIDELLGGYWLHRVTPEVAFPDYWHRLEPEHLAVLLLIAKETGIEPVFPYLQWDVVEVITSIPFNQRTSRECSKMPLREIAREVGVPATIIERQKIGLCDVLTLDERTRATI